MTDEWSDRDRVAEYLSREVPHRHVAEEMMLLELALIVAVKGPVAAS